MIVNELHNTVLNNPVRQFTAKAELYNGSALFNTFWHADYLKSFDVERVGEAKFFGYGICQKANIKLIDVNRVFNITTANSFKCYLGASADYITPFPTFYVTEVNRDENTGELSITAYDALNKAAAHTISEVDIPTATDDEGGYSIYTIALACANHLGIAAIELVNVNDESFNTFYDEGANLDGAESIREVLNAIAEATQTIYYINAAGALVFKRLDKDGEAAAALTKDVYFTLDSKTNRRLSTITSATELGDNVTVSIDALGTTQVVRDNPFWELREDIAELLDAAIDAIGGLTINQFNCSWRGNYLVEIGDKLALTTKDGGTVYSYLLNDKCSYNGGFSQATEWSYAEDNVASSNANTLGEVLKQTFAKVDKANKQIDIVASEAAANKDAIAAIQLNTESINATVQSMEKNTTDALEGVATDIATLTNRVNATMTSEDIKLEVQSQIEENGTTKVVTSTGFTFDDTGLTVTKENSEMSTTITEDGMTVYKDNQEMLVANNKGVNAVNLHATTYLIIGTNSRLEDYEGSRTGCFWIGGNS
ncbi:MAG: hypothetical protein J6C08_00135 [Campylobacter sp.]|uniref:hypothetical protein n=1 Tax=Campylobacter sp. TaxID=205 RepID=UPI001B08F01D|nr:hypothetical protein [Campylobacter sp.]MBO5062908.1 hypothetical protein [Campylobacter sp.]